MSNSSKEWKVGNLFLFFSVGHILNWDDDDAENPNVAWLKGFERNVILKYSLSVNTFKAESALVIENKM